jgi:hypothetical protein
LRKTKNAQINLIKIKFIINYCLQFIYVSIIENSDHTNRHGMCPFGPLVLHINIFEVKFEIIPNIKESVRWRSWEKLKGYCWNFKKILWLSCVKEWQIYSLYKVCYFFMSYNREKKLVKERGSLNLNKILSVSPSLIDKNFKIVRSKSLIYMFEF